MTVSFLQASIALQVNRAMIGDAHFLTRRVCSTIVVINSNYPCGDSVQTTDTSSTSSAGELA